MPDSSIGDLVAATLEASPKNRVEPVAAKLVDYPIATKILRQKKITQTGGYNFARKIWVGRNGQARMVRLYEPDSVNRQDLVVTATAPWTHMDNAYAYDRREVLMNRGKQQIFDYIKLQAAECNLGVLEKIEEQAFASPTGTSDDTSMMGIPFWIQKNATRGFNGGNPSGFSSGRGGISTTTWPAWANWTDTYDAFSRADFIQKMKDMMYYIGWRNPVPTMGESGNSMSQKMLITNYTVETNATLLAEDQNENLGNDLDSKGGLVRFHKMAFLTVPQLQPAPDGTSDNANGGGDTTNPVYCVDFSCFQPVVLQGDYFHETVVDNEPNHNSASYFVDLTMNWFCFNLRKQGVIYNPA